MAMTEEMIREFIKGVILETREDDLAKIRMANNSYLAIQQKVFSLNKDLVSFERVFRKDEGRLASMSLGTFLRRDEHVKMFVNFLERTLMNAPPGYMASAQLRKNGYHINIYFTAPQEVIGSTRAYNKWFAQNLDAVLSSSKMRSFYVHEFIHTLDFKRIPKDYLYQRPVQQTVIGTPEYANAPLEMNAYFLQAISYVRRKLKKAQTQEEVDALIGRTPQEFVDKFMSTYLNKELRMLLAPENRQRLMKRAATSWELLRKVK
jgi:hypothetical protein